VSIADPNTVQICGGGGGGCYNGSRGIGKSGGGDGGATGRTPQNGVANKGGGGGGHASHSATGGQGGSGVIYLKYPVGYTATFSGGATQTTTTIGNYKHVKITAGYNETVTFG
jgi:hypothetical protein